jgi:hypothetical protein
MSRDSARRGDEGREEGSEQSIVDVQQNRLDKVVPAPKLADAVEGGEDLELIEEAVYGDGNTTTAIISVIRRRKVANGCEKKTHRTPSIDRVKTPNISKYPLVSVFSNRSFEKVISAGLAVPSCCSTLSKQRVSCASRQNEEGQRKRTGSSWKRQSLICRNSLSSERKAMPSGLERRVSMRMQPSRVHLELPYVLRNVDEDQSRRSGLM